MIDNRTTYIMQADIQANGPVPNDSREAYMRGIAAALRSGTCENISDPPEGFLCSECGWGDFCEPSHLLTSAKFSGRMHGGPNFCPNCGAKVMSNGQ